MPGQWDIAWKSTAPRPLRLERVSNFARPKLSNFARSKSLTLNFGQQYRNTALRLCGSFAIMSAMKATIQIPDEMYREVKAKSALEGRSVRSITVMLYTSWLRGLVPEPDSSTRFAVANPVSGKKPNLSCFGVGRRFVRKNAEGPHDMASMRESIAAGRKMA